MSDHFTELLFAIAFGVGIFLTIKYLWPLILVIVVFIGFGIWRARHMMRKAEEAAEKEMGTYEEEPEEVPQYEQDLFREQTEKLKKRPAGEIVDAEFTVKDEANKEQHS